MLWRVRTTLADRPGALASLAARCGAHDVNILALQIFPGVDGVTDELVLRAPAGWTMADVATLVEAAGGRAVTGGPCSEHALVDAPTRFLAGVRQVVHGEPAGPVLTRLLDGEPTSAPSGGAAVRDVLAVRVGGERVEVRRTAPFTATEHARAQAFADAVADLGEPAVVTAGVLAPPAGAPTLVRVATATDAAAVAALHARCSAETVRRAYGAPLARVDARLARRLLVGGAGALVAVAGDHVVGLAALGEAADGGCELALVVQDDRQRQGIGTRLLAHAARLAGGAGVSEVTLRVPADSSAAVATVFASGLRARVRLAGDELVVSVATRGLAPLPPGAMVPPPASQAVPVPAGRST